MSNLVSNWKEVITLGILGTELQSLSFTYNLTL